MHKEKLQDYAQGGSVFETWRAFEAHWRKTIKDCAWVKVESIQSLSQRGKAWTVKYAVRDASVTQPINPVLALELLNETLVGRTLTNAWFIINPTRVEDMVIIENA